MSLIQETDFGTPPSKSSALVTLTIDGQEITVPEGTSIMRAAMQAGTQIPKLCATDMVDAFGSCRLCLIEIEGRAGTPAFVVGISLAGLLLALLGGLASLAVWRRGGAETRGRRFVGAIGALLASLSAFAMIMQAVASLIVPACFS